MRMKGGSVRIASIRTRHGDMRRGRAASVARVLLLLAAFFLQSFVAATHIHGAPLFGHAAALSHASQDAARLVHSDHQPPFDNPADCPFCQAVAHAGAYAMGAIAVALPPLDSRILAPLIWQRTHSSSYRGHDRPQRGPPARHRG